MVTTKRELVRQTLWAWTKRRFQFGFSGLVVSFGFVFVVILRLIGFVFMVSGFDVVIAVLMSAVLVDDDDVVSMIGFACMLG